MLRTEQIAILNAARAVLRRIEGDARDEYAATSDESRARSYGMVEAKAETAEGAIFDLLNVADTELGLELSSAVLHNSNT